jgi:F-type H+-transporting ATPase subunit delta
MTNRTAASRYARALLEVGIAEKADLSAIEQQLSEIVALFQAHPALEKILLNPVVPAPRKRSAMVELTRRPGVSTSVAKLLVLLAERDRLVLVPDIEVSYRERLLDYQKVVRADVTTAEPLPPDRAKALEQSLARITGRRVTMTTKVDPTIVGGIVTRIGSTVYDGSVTRHLERMRQQLTANV